MVEDLSAKEIMTREFNSLRGRLFSVIESAGLPKQQERAIITLIKNLSFQNQAVAIELISKLDSEGQLFRYNQNKLDDN